MVNVLEAWSKTIFWLALRTQSIMAPSQCMHCGGEPSKLRRLLDLDQRSSLNISTRNNKLFRVCRKCFSIIERYTKLRLELNARKREDGDDVDERWAMDDSVSDESITGSGSLTKLFQVNFKNVLPASTSTSKPAAKPVKPPSKKRKRVDPDSEEMSVTCDSGTMKVARSVQPAVKWLCRRRYGSAASSLVRLYHSASESAKKSLKLKVAQESRYFCQSTQQKGLGIFPFRISEVYQELQLKCPTLCCVLNAVVHPNKREVAAPRIYAAAMILLQTRNQQVNAFQKLVSLLLWKGKLKSMFFRRLKVFGLTLSRPTVLKVIDSLSCSFDRKIKNWQQAVSHQEDIQSASNLVLGSMVNVGLEDDDEDGDWIDIPLHPSHEDTLQDGDLPDNDDNNSLQAEEICHHGYAAPGPDPLLETWDHVYTASALDPSVIPAVIPVLDVSALPDMEDAVEIPMIQEVANLEEDEDSGMQILDLEDIQQNPVTTDEMAAVEATMPIVEHKLHPSYQLVFDNVNIVKQARHKSTKHRNQQHNLVQAYAVLDRVCVEGLANVRPQLPDIRMLPSTTWWLPPQEQTAIKEEIMTLIMRIATNYVPCLKCLAPQVEQHIEHQYSKETASTSEVNKLGLFNIDEMYTAQMVTLMEKLQAYCPKTLDGHVHKLPLGGDGLSVMKAHTAQRARSDGFCDETSLSGLLPKPEDWHEGVIILQDTFKHFYKIQSLRQKGTLYHLRELFDRRGVKASAKDAVNDNREFLHFVTHGFVVLATMHVLGIDNLEGIPCDCPSESDSIEAKQNFLQALAKEIVDSLVFPCGVLPSHSKQDDEAHPDHKKNYICALMREGLLDMARMDAVKEGDGMRILRHWRYDFIHFEKYNHYNYRLLTFRFIANVYGLLTPRMAAALVHNRTVNSYGGVGNNVSLDLFLEFLNKEVKDDLKRSGPNLTPKLLERIGQSKQIMDELLHIFDHDVELYTGIGRHKRQDWSAEVSQLIMELKPESLFHNQPGREFKTFPKFPMNRIHSVNQQKLEAWVTVQLTYLHMGM